MPNKLRELKNRVREHAADRINEQSDVLVYHDIGHHYRIEKYINIIADSEEFPEDEVNLLKMALWINGVGFAESKIRKIDFEKSEMEVHKIVNDFAETFKFEDSVKEYIISTLIQSMPHQVSESMASKVFSDAFIMDFSRTDGKERLRKFYEELILKNFKLEQKNWYELILNILAQKRCQTEYGKEHIQPQIDKLTKKIAKEKKELDKREHIVLRKELGISEAEIKQLKKDLIRAKRRDARGIQTLFRLTIRNHYTLNEMVDRKANIMITVNSIILSLVVGGIIGNTDHRSPSEFIPILALMLTCSISIIYAILSIRPNKTHGNFSEEEIRNRQGNLLYFGNFHRMHFRDFEWAFLQMLNDSDYLYSSMIRDYFHLGLSLDIKYRFLRKSLTIFLFGFVATILLYLIVRFQLAGN